MTAKAKAANRPPYLNSLACPHCKEPARVRSSRQMTELIRQLYLRCTNDFCGHVFAADLTITHTISPSATPDPDVHLRQWKRSGADNDNTQPARGPEVPPGPPANDDDAPDNPVPLKN